MAYTQSYEAWYTNPPQVLFGGVQSPSVTVNSDTSVTATSPPGSGTVAVQIINSLGQSVHTANDSFTYQ